jgi:hypothetical protein
MKKVLMITAICAALAFTACHTNQNTASGDSTGTGATGARVPGKVTADTTRHDSTGNSLSADTGAKKQ